jgi:hypothetical protein
MKTLIIILLIAGSSLAISQTYEPSQVKFKWWDSTYVYFSPDQEYFDIDNFVLGWHWGGSVKMTEALLCNQHDAGHWANLNDIADSCYVFLKPHHYSHAVGPEILNARGIQYEPTLYIPPANRGEFITKPIGSDINKPIFGFSYIDGETTSSSGNADRLELKTGSSYQGEVVLENTWLNDEFNYHELDQTDLSEEEWIISINLKRTNTLQTAQITDQILEIKLPYKKCYTSVTYN